MTSVGNLTNTSTQTLRDVLTRLEKKAQRSAISMYRTRCC